MTQSILLRNGLIFDGTGSAPLRGSVLLKGESIAQVGDGPVPGHADVIDCTDLAIAPGFIDGHSHSDLQVLDSRPEKLLQGVTTEIVGNCGFSPFPAARNRAELHDFAGGILCGRGDWGWSDVREYLDAVEKGSGTTGVVPLVGHGTLRISVAGQRLGQLDKREQEQIEGLLDDALASGAVGFSTGLMYSPGASAPAEELRRLCAIVAHRGKVYATHMRDYGDRLVEAVDGQLELASQTGCRLQISHLQAVGPRNWPRQQVALDRIEAARPRRRRRVRLLPVYPGQHCSNATAAAIGAGRRYLCPDHPSARSIAASRDRGGNRPRPRAGLGRHSHLIRRVGRE